MAGARARARATASSCVILLDGMERLRITITVLLFSIYSAVCDPGPATEGTCADCGISTGGVAYVYIDWGATPPQYANGLSEANQPMGCQSGARMSVSPVYSSMRLPPGSRR